MNYKVLLTGARGLLGRKIIQLSPHYPNISLVSTARDMPKNQMNFCHSLPFFPCNLSAQEDFEKLLEQERPDTIIHTAAMTQVDACEEQPIACRRSNIDPIYTIVAYAQLHKAHVVFLSTDFVYDGCTDYFYTEDAPTNPLSQYGNSKLKAEQILCKELANSVTVLRTALVYGYSGSGMRKNFLTWVKGELEMGKAIKVVTDQNRCPTWVDDLAHLCLRAVEVRQGGIFHACGKDYLSILQAVLQVAEIGGLDKTLIQPIETSMLQTSAERPPRTPLSIKKAIEAFDYQPHSYQQGVVKVLKEIAII